MHAVLWVSIPIAYSPYAYSLVSLPIVSVVCFADLRSLAPTYL